MLALDLKAPLSFHVELVSALSVSSLFAAWQFRYFSISLNFIPQWDSVQLMLFSRLHEMNYPDIDVNFILSILLEAPLLTKRLSPSSNVSAPQYFRKTIERGIGTVDHFFLKNTTGRVKKCKVFKEPLSDSDIVNVRNLTSPWLSTPKLRFWHLDIPFSFTISRDIKPWIRNSGLKILKTGQRAGYQFCWRKISHDL